MKVLANLYKNETLTYKELYTQSTTLQDKILSKGSLQYYFARLLGLQYKKAVIASIKDKQMEIKKYIR
jgi:hypothetical protein